MAELPDNRVEPAPPFSNCAVYYRGSFRVSGTKIWNSLPLKLRGVQELTRFKSGLKKLFKSS